MRFTVGRLHQAERRPLAHTSDPDQQGLMLRPGFLILRGSHACMSEVFAQMANGAAVERVSVMRSVQDAFGTVELHPDPVSLEWRMSHLLGRDV